MGRSKITIVLLALALILSSNYVKAADTANTQSDQSNTSNVPKSIDVEQFKQELNEVSSTPEATATIPLAGRVKTLTTRYLLAPGDLISLSVYGEPEFTQPEILVRPDGYATIEPFGEMYVAGSDINQLTGTLKDQFKSYLLDPRISVKITGMHAAKVYIYGAVQKPGYYQQESVANRDPSTGRVSTIAPDLTIASVISNAGGIKYNADLRHIMITNNSAGRNEEIDLMKLIENGDSSQDVFLRSGDSIYIPELASDAQISDRDFLLISSSSLAPVDFPVRVIGAVNMPGVYKLSPNSSSLNSAIASAQGYSLDANRKTVTVQRMTPRGNVSTFYINPVKNDLVLRPNDIVIVNDKATSLASRGFTLLSNVIDPFARFADSFNSWALMFNPGRFYGRWF